MREESSLRAHKLNHIEIAAGALQRLHQLYEVERPYREPQGVALQQFKAMYMRCQQRLAAQLHLIVPGDDDLLVVQVFEGIPILIPAMALQFIGDVGNLSRPEPRVDREFMFET